MTEHGPLTFNDLKARHSRVPARKIALGIAGLLGAWLAWAAFAQLDEVTVAEGDVIPQGQVKVIQHLEGGIITQMMVQPGTSVQTGTPLLQLDLAATAINRDELRLRNDGQKLTIARLQSEANATPLSLPEDLVKKHPMLASAERQTHQAKIRELESSLSVLKLQYQQKQEEYREQTAKNRSLQTSLKLAETKLQMSRELLRDGLTSKMDHLQQETEVEALRGELAILKHSLPRAKAALEEAQNRIEETRLAFQRQASEALSAAQLSLARTAELLSTADDQQLRTTIRSPIDGIVKNLRFVTIGGVVKPGDPIMEIVPINQKLLIDARLNPADRGYVRPGQPALVKISTYDYARYGGLTGKVISVAPDTSSNGSSPPYFQVMIETDQTWLGDNPGEYPITTGMLATVDIHTGTRSVLDYLIRPVLKLKHEAFRER